MDKKDAINGVDAEKVMESIGIKFDDEIFLIVDDVTNKVKEIHNKITIASLYNIDPNLTTLEVGEEYLRIREEQNKQQEEETTTLEKQAVRIAELEQGQANTEYILMEGGLI